jgi:ferredoxin-NADP reductase
MSKTMEKNNTVIWSIVEKRNETPGVFSLVLKSHEERPTFIAGQYLTVRLPHFEPLEGKSYSIASTPSEDTITLTVKAMGKFSRAILAHEIGDTITTSLPYGFFYPEPDESSGIAFVVGGIGITPCMSIIKNLLKGDYQKPITLFYSNRTHADIVFKDRLDTLSQSHPNFKIHYFITREEGTHLEFHTERMTADFIATNTPNLHETDFFICGSIDFTKTLWTSLKDSGISSPRLYTEGFF